MTNTHPSLRILVVGGCHAYGYGIPFGQGFVQRTLTELTQAGFSLATDYYAPAKMTKLSQLRRHNPFFLDNYDLVLVQVGHLELLSRSIYDLFQQGLNVNAVIYGKYEACMDQQLRPNDVRALHFCLPDQPGGLAKVSLHVGGHSGRKKIKAILLSAGLAGPLILPYISAINRQFKRIIRLLNGYQDRVILIAPTPTQEPITNQLRHWGAHRWQQEADRFGFSIVNIIDESKTVGGCWQADGYHLNATGHEWLFQSLRVQVAKLLKGRLEAQEEWHHASVW